MSVRFKLSNVRLSYEHVFKPTRFDDNQEAKYSATFIIPKNHPDLPAVKRAMVEAGREEYASAFGGNSWPKGFTCSLKDADTEVNSLGEVLAEKNPSYKGCYILEANSTRRPVTVNRDKSALTEDDGVIYSGCYVNASLAADAYEYGKVKRGVKVYLNGVQFVRDGERFGVDALDDFEELGEVDVFGAIAEDDFLC